MVLRRIRVADAADDPWIGKSPFESAVLGSQRIAKRVKVAAEDVDSSRIHALQCQFASEHILRMRDALCRLRPASCFSISDACFRAGSR